MIATRLRQFGGVVPGFDILRLAAASMVLVSHAFPITQGEAGQEPLHRLTGGQMTFGTLAVMIFFAVSGFVVTASLERSSNLLSFIRKRALRLLPALIVVVLATVLVLGPLLTTDPLGRYFGHPATWRYVLNAVFAPSYVLPGVFEAAPYPQAVNGSLWTLRWEVLSYTALVVLWLTVLKRWRWMAPLTALAALLIGAVLARTPNAGPLAMFEPASFLFAAFMSGASLYVLRDRFPADLRIAGLLVVLLVPAAWAGVLREVASVTVAYVCLVVSLKSWPRLRNDYSYGVYLWAFPIQQIVVTTGAGVYWWSNIVLSGVATLFLAALSWRLVEEPALRYKGGGGATPTNAFSAPESARSGG